MTDPGARRRGSAPVDGHRTGEARPACTSAGGAPADYVDHALADHALAEGSPLPSGPRESRRWDPVWPGVPRAGATRIALVRHGETVWNREGRLQGRRGAELTPQGRRQAAAAAARLARLGPWEWLGSSTAFRAVQTVGIIADTLLLPCLAPDPRLVERGYGRAEGMLAAEASRLWPDGCYPESEPTEVATRRVLSAVQTLADERPGHPGAVVAHGVLIRLLVTALTGAPSPRVEHGEICVVDVVADGLRLVRASDPTLLH